MSKRYVHHPAKRCRFDDTKRCYHSQCDLISSLGVVSVCPLYRGGDKFSPRKISPVHASVFELLGKHVKHQGRGQ